MVLLWAGSVFKTVFNKPESVTISSVWHSEIRWASCTILIKMGGFHCCLVHQSKYMYMYMLAFLYIIKQYYRIWFSKIFSSRGIIFIWIKNYNVIRVNETLSYTCTESTNTRTDSTLLNTCKSNGNKICSLLYIKYFSPETVIFHWILYERFRKYYFLETVKST